jgi:hypothetical protein
MFIALSASALADGVDGVLITHAKALAGNVTPGDGAGYPVTLSRPGLYKLAGNLVVPAGLPPPGSPKIGIEVTAADATIDLNGYRIHAFGRPYTIGIRSTEPSITIRNGTIAGFGLHGILAHTGSSKTCALLSIESVLRPAVASELLCATIRSSTMEMEFIVVSPVSSKAILFQAAEIQG